MKILTENLEPGTNRVRFRKMYVYFGPLKQVFVQFRRHIADLNECHLKCPFGGQLLAAVGVDANDGMYPLQGYLYKLRP